MRGMWRFADRLPVVDRAKAVTLGEGDTPVLALPALAARLGVASIHLKLEDRNPTGSFKARIASVAASLVKERGLAGLVGTSSGNGGAAAAAYAAAAGTRAVLFTLSDTIPMKMLEITAAGGTAYRVSGVGHDAASTRRVAELIAGAAEYKGYYPMLTGFTFAPEAMIGVESIAWELAEELPETTAVYAPVGGGGLLTGLARGYRTTACSPRIVGVHPAGASAIAYSLEGDTSGMPGPVTSAISGLQMAVLYDPEGAADAVRSTGGHATAVSDDETWSAQALLARDFGVLAEPAGAVALAGLRTDVVHGTVGKDDHVVLIVTGAGYKDASALERLAADAAPVATISPTEVSAALAALEGAAR